MKQEEDGINYFWDTYAIIELENGNPNYLEYSKNPVVITIFNLAEVYWVILNRLGKELADEIYVDYCIAVANISDEVLKEAMKFRKKNKKRDLSYSDCIGYVYALKNNLKFLTGDKEFENLENVEFVK